MGLNSSVERRIALMVEDDEAIATLFQLYLEDVGYKEILEAANTQKALDIVNVLEQQREESHLDLLICDIRLDGSENGIRLVERLAERK